jgi:hypothetical protein
MFVDVRLIFARSHHTIRSAPYLRVSLVFCVQHFDDHVKISLFSVYVSVHDTVPAGDIRDSREFQRLSLAIYSLSRNPVY